MKKLLWITAIVTSLTPAVVVSFLFLREIQQLSSDQLKQNVQREVDIGLKDASAFIQERFGNLIEWSRGPAVKVAFEFRRPEGLNVNLDFLKAQYPYYDSISIFDEKLQLFAQTKEASEVQIQSYSEILSSKKSQLFIFNSDHSVSLFYKLLNPITGTFEGVILANVSSHKFNELLSEILNRLKSLNLNSTHLLFQMDSQSSRSSSRSSSKSSPILNEQLICAKPISSMDSIKLCAQIQDEDLNRGWNKISGVLIGSSIAMIFFVFLIWNYFLNSITAPFYQILKTLSAMIKGESLPFKINSRFSEVQNIALKLNDLLRELKEARDQLAIQTREQALYELSLQLAHDIRSPLSVLTILEVQIEEWPEEKRLLMREATRRITNIANDLMIKQKKSMSEPIPSSHRTLEMITPLIESIVSEKRVQFRNKLNLLIEADLEDSYGGFSEINKSDIQRVFSNLINNSVEALGDKGGRISIGARVTQSQIKLFIFDNGPGIPPHLLARIGEKGLTSGKENSTSGTGLGLYHAKKTIEDHEGQFHVDSRQGQGTRIEITLNRKNPPPWFLNELSLSIQGPVVVVDDDKSIHLVWNERLSQSVISHASTETDLKNILDNLPADSSKPLFLVDFEFLGQKYNGIDLITRFHLEKSAILVTSRFNDPSVRELVDKHQLKVLPKSLIGLVPIDYLLKSRDEILS